MTCMSETWFDSQVSCPQWPSPRPALETHGHRLSWVPISECAGRCPLTNPWEYPVRYPLLPIKMKGRTNKKQKVKTALLSFYCLKPNINLKTFWIGSPLRFLIKSSSFIFLSALTLGLYMSVLRRMMANARMKIVSGFWNWRMSAGLHTQYLWLLERKKLILMWNYEMQRKEHRVRWEQRLPEGLYQPLHLLGFPLNLNLSLKLPQGVIQIHAREIHLIQYTAEKEKQKARSLHLSANKFVLIF